MSSDEVAAVGAFLSGAGSVLGAWFVLRTERKRLAKECDERVRMLEHGIAIGEHLHPESEGHE